MALAGCSAPTSAQLVAQAQKELDSGHAASAIRRLESAYKANPKDKVILEALGLAHLSGGDPLRAGELLNTLALNSTPDYHLYAADAFKKANSPEKAIEAYRFYLLSEPKQSAVWQDLGLYQAQQGLLAEALASLNTAHQLEASPELALNIAALSAQNGNPTSATRFYQSALKQAKAKRPASSAPSQLEAKALDGLIRIAATEKSFSEAARHYKQLERDFPAYPNLTELKPLTEGKAAPKTKDANPKSAKKSKEEPSSETSKAEAPSTESSEASAKVSVTPSSGKKLPTEVSLPAEKVTPILPSASLTEKPIAAPKDPYLLAVEKDSKNPSTWAALAAKKASEGDYAWAEAAYLEALRLKPDDPTLTLAYLEVLKNRRPTREFLDECEKILRRTEDKIPELYLLTARTYRDVLKNNRNASILLRQFLQKFPKHKDAPAAQKELDALPK